MLREERHGAQPSQYKPNDASKTESEKIEQEKKTKRKKKRKGHDGHGPETPRQELGDGESKHAQSRETKGR